MTTGQRRDRIVRRTGSAVSGHEVDAGTSVRGPSGAWDVLWHEPRHCPSRRRSRKVKIRAATMWQSASHHEQVAGLVGKAYNAHSPYVHGDIRARRPGRAFALLHHAKRLAVPTRDRVTSSKQNPPHARHPWDEGRSQIRTGHDPENMATLRNTGLSPRPGSQHKGS